MTDSILRVASFNIRFGTAHDGIHSWRFRSFATTRLIDKLNCDIIGLQEAHLFQIKKVLRRLVGYEYVGDGRDGGYQGEHCPVLFDTSRWNIRDTSTHWYGRTPDNVSLLPGAIFPRIVTRAQLVSPSGQHVDLFNTHLDHKDNELRQQSMDQLLTMVDPDIPTIVMGDFNAHRDNAVFSQIESKGLRFAHSADCGGTDFYHYSLPGPDKAIDHILISDHFDVVSAHVVRERVWHMLPSDHWPVTAELRL
ncbi:MAG TPA: endonuclease/exonuclease/phosphatase family protein [Acidimicrobiia bacterium]|nr:endonuclease/exonuclease/phosphatase family protein [Acidimicrobiia bacterium]